MLYVISWNQLVDKTAFLTNLYAKERLTLMWFENRCCVKFNARDHWKPHKNNEAWKKKMKTNKNIQTIWKIELDFVISGSSTTGFIHWVYKQFLETFPLGNERKTAHPSPEVKKKNLSTIEQCHLMCGARSTFTPRSRRNKGVRHAFKVLQDILHTKRSWKQNACTF